MKIELRTGHLDNCTGAIGIVDEHEQMKSIMERLKMYLESMDIVL